MQQHKYFFFKDPLSYSEQECFFSKDHASSVVSFLYISYPHLSMIINSVNDQEGQDFIPIALPVWTLCFKISTGITKEEEAKPKKTEKGMMFHKEIMKAIKEKTRKKLGKKLNEKEKEKFKNLKKTIKRLEMKEHEKNMLREGK